MDTPGHDDRIYVNVNAGRYQSAGIERERHESARRPPE
jgi:hypothetical protein